MPFQYLTNFPMDEALQKYQRELAARGMTYKTENVKTTEALSAGSPRRRFMQESARRITTPALWTALRWMPR